MPIVNLLYSADPAEGSLGGGCTSRNTEATTQVRDILQESASMVKPILFGVALIFIMVFGMACGGAEEP